MLVVIVGVIGFVLAFFLWTFIRFWAVENGIPILWHSGILIGSITSTGIMYFLSHTDPTITLLYGIGVLGLLIILAFVSDGTYAEDREKYRDSHENEWKYNP
ncbi:MAG: hypothetical protein ABEI06_08490 [Halobacteriaceae archaeon]